MSANSVLEVIGNLGLCYRVGLPNYGQQALGITPSGAADQLGFRQAHILLGEPESFESLEVIFPPQAIEFKTDALFCLTGAEFASMKLFRAQATLNLQHAVVYQASAGDKLQLAGLRQGMRSYVVVIENHLEINSRVGLARGAFEHWFTKYDNLISIVAGPEIDYLVQPQQFYQQAWQISLNSNAMGIRLNSAQPVELSKTDIISSPVCNGTIQFTASGPIVLLSQRQTIGGYPRGFVVTPSSLDKLVQIAANRWVKFNLISREQALIEQYEYLERLGHFREFCSQR